MLLLHSDAETAVIVIMTIFSAMCHPWRIQLRMNYRKMNQSQGFIWLTLTHADVSQSDMGKWSFTALPAIRAHVKPVKAVRNSCHIYHYCLLPFSFPLIWRRAFWGKSRPEMHTSSVSTQVFYRIGTLMVLMSVTGYDSESPNQSDVCVLMFCNDCVWIYDYNIRGTLLSNLRLYVEQTYHLSCVHGWHAWQWEIIMTEVNEGRIGIHMPCC